MRSRSVSLVTVAAVTAVAGVAITRVVAQTPPPDKPLTIAGAMDLRPPMNVDFVQTWAKDARAHDAGVMDDAAKEIGAWPAKTAAVTLTDVASLARIAEWLETQPPGTAVKYRRHTVVLDGHSGTGSDRVAIDVLLDLRADSDRLVQINRLVERGVMLHTDLAIDVFRAIRERTQTPTPAPDSTSSRAARTAAVVDGQMQVSFDDLLSQWMNARYLVDAVQTTRSRQAPPREWTDIRPDPSGDPLMRRWYRAVSAWQANRGTWGSLQPLLERGLVVFPDDAWLHFVNGAMHEAFAAPSAQIVARDMVLSGSTPQVKTASRELQTAEGELRRTLDLDPGFDEARLHLGHVLGLEARHADAIAELAPLPARFSDPVLRYDAMLFLGRERAAAGDAAGAHAAFDAAAAVYPHAQSPKIGASVLESDAGDLPASAALVLSLLQAPAASAAGESADPYWTYGSSHVRDADSRVAELRRVVNAQVRR